MCRVLWEYEDVAYTSCRIKVGSTAPAARGNSGLYCGRRAGVQAENATTNVVRFH